MNKINKEMKERFFRALNYLSILVYILVVYGGALICDYLLFGLIAWLLRNDIAQYPVVATWFENAKIGLALLLIFSAFVHGVLSTISQIRIDITISKKERKN